MSIYFEIDIACYNDSNNEIRNKIALILKKLSDASSNFHQNTLYRIKLFVGLSRLKIGNEFDIVYQNTMNKEYNNDVLLRLSIWRGVIEDKNTPLGGAKLIRLLGGVICREAAEILLQNPV